MAARSTEKLLIEARAYIIEIGKVSASAMARKLRVGWSVADGLLAELEAEGLVSAPTGLAAELF